MPRQGNTVESCIITDWKVPEGSTVTNETVICEVETDKASFEVPAGAAGTVLKLLHAAGDDVPVLQPIAVIGAPGENWQSVLGSTGQKGAGNSESGSEPYTNAQGQQKTIPASEVPVAASSNIPVSPYGAVSGISPRAKNLAAREALPLEMVPSLAGTSGTGPGGRIIERDVMAALQNRPLLTAAAKAAMPKTIPQAGSGIGGRVTSADVAAVADVAAAADRATASGQPSPFPISQPITPRSISTEGNITETPIKGIRKIIADRMFKSLAETAQFTLNMSAPALKLQETRSRIKTQAEYAEELGLSKVSINDLILFAAARTLPRFPFMNAHKTGDTLRIFERVHLAVAVDTPKGLMVPVIRNANLLSLTQISSEAKRLAAACQNGTANPDELSGSTFTVTNLGSLGVSGFTPVINYPEVAILGVCNIEMKPVAVTQAAAQIAAQTAAMPAANSCNCDCGVRFEPQIGFSLTINHQAVDGAPAARFLKALCEAIENIDLLLAAS